MKIQGKFFQPTSSQSHQASLIVRDQHVRVEFENGDSIRSLYVDFIQGSRDIYFQGGEYFRAEYDLPKEFVDSNRSPVQRRILWLEKFSFTKAIVLVCLLVVCLLAFRALFYSLGSIVVVVFPQTWEERVGEEAYASLSPLFFTESRIPPGIQSTVRSAASQIIEDAGLTRDVDIFFHDSEHIGPNALAFPGGPIVLTDELVRLLSEEETLAVVAHELAHVEKRHSLQQAIDVIGISILALMIFGADESIVEELTVIIADTTILARSREFEKEADLEAIKYLFASGLNPSGMVTAMQKLTDFYCRNDSGELAFECESEVLAWISTHPSGEDRIRYLKEAIQLL